MYKPCRYILHEPSALRHLALLILNTLFCKYKQDKSQACFLSRHCLLEKQCRARQNRGEIFLFCRSYSFSGMVAVICCLLQFGFEYSVSSLLVLHIELAIHAGNMAFIRKTEIPVVPYDQMFMNGYAHYLAGKNELTCYGNIIRGRLGVA